jgi:hypothetical protein
MKDEMDRECSMQGDMRNYYKILAGSPVWKIALGGGSSARVGNPVASRHKGQIGHGSVATLSLN